MRHLFILLLLFSWNTWAKNIATFQKKGSKKVFSIPFQHVQLSYQMILQSTLNPPSKSQFTKDFVRYRIVVEEAYQDPSLLRSTRIKNQIKNTELKSHFEQLLYKVFVSNRLKRNFSQINTSIQKLSLTEIKQHYQQNPSFSFSFIVIGIPASATKEQIAKLRKKAQGIYHKVKKDQRPFEQLVNLYSDNKRIGKGGVIHSKSTVYPLLYNALQKLKANQMSQPIQVPNGFYILKMNQILGFENINQEDIKQQISAIQKSKAFNAQMSQMLKDYKVQINSKMVSQL